MKMSCHHLKMGRGGELCHDVLSGWVEGGRSWEIHKTHSEEAVSTEQGRSCYRKAMTSRVR